MRRRKKSRLRSRRGTGNILQDLLFCTIHLPKINVEVPNPAVKSLVKGQDQGHGGHKALDNCSICCDECIDCDPPPLKKDMIKLLDDLVWKPFAPFLLHLTPSWDKCLCSKCVITLRKLAELKNEMDKIIHSIRAVVRIPARMKNVSEISSGVSANPLDTLQKGGVKEGTEILSENIELEITDIESDQESEIDESEVQSKEGDEPLDSSKDDLVLETGYSRDVCFTFVCNMDNCHKEFTTLEELVSHKKTHPEKIASEEEQESSLIPKFEEEIIKMDLNEDEEMKPVVLDMELDLGELEEEFYMNRNEVGTDLTTNNCQDIVIKDHSQGHHENAEEGDTNSNLCGIAPSNISASGLSHHDPSSLEGFPRLAVEIMDEPEKHVLDLNRPTPDPVEGGRPKRKCRVRAEELLKSKAADRDEEGEGSGDDDFEDQESDSSYPEDGDSSDVAEEEQNSTGFNPNNRTPKGSKIFVPKPIPKNPLVLETSYEERALIASELHKSQPNPGNKCEICNLIFWSELSTHLSSVEHNLAKTNRRVGSDGKVTFFCKQCNCSFISIEKLRDHCYKEVKKLAHSNDPDLLSETHAQMIGHEAVAELKEKKLLHCVTCGETFPTGNKLCIHKRRHGINFICDICGKQLTTKQTFDYHMSHVHSGKPPTIRKAINRFVTPEDKPSSCPQCDKRFAHKSGMYWHLKTVHKGFRYKCDLCDKEYTSLNGLKLHKKLNHETTSCPVDPSAPSAKTKTTLKKLTCDICATTCAGKNNLNRHMELKHFPDKEACPYGCPDKIGSEEEWRLHLEQCKSDKITESSKCYCFFCGELFSNQLLRIAHHLDRHKSYPCELCSRSFTQYNTRTWHVYEHKEARPFLCPKCGKRFRQIGHLQIHTTTVCGDDEVAKNALIEKRRQLHRIYREKDKPHKCQLCSKRFITEVRLRCHQSKAHLSETNTDSGTGEDEERN